MVDFLRASLWEKNRLRQHRFQIRVVRPSKRCEVPVPCSGQENRRTMQTRDIDYRDPTANLRGYLAWDETATERRPGVLVFHEGLGLGEFAMARARMLAELGHVALAADMFGDRRQARNLEEAAKLIGELRSEPETLRARGRAALATLAALPQVDAGRIAAPSHRPAPLTVPYRDFSELNEREGLRVRHTRSLTGGLNPW
jgi:hypothetical protein